MYIKWISDYAISKKLEGKRVLFRSLTPILAEAKRINGKPYSQNIKRLGTYYEYFGLRYRYAYWHQLEVRLINLGLSKEEIERLKSSVGKRIPPSQMKKLIPILSTVTVILHPSTAIIPIT